eukprot:471743-Pelagomonas_calceolata.AAC.1
MAYPSKSGPSPTETRCTCIADETSPRAAALQIIAWCKTLQKAGGLNWRSTGISLFDPKCGWAFQLSFFLQIDWSKRQRRESDTHHVHEWIGLECHATF